MFSNVFAVLVDLHSIVGSLFVAVLQVGVFSFSIARMRSVGLRKIHKGFVFRECEFAESPGVVVEVDIPCPTFCFAVVGRLFVVNKDLQNCKHSIQSLAHRTKPGGMREAIKLINRARAGGL